MTTYASVHRQPLAQALAAMLKRAEPPICVGLYARWGSGKTFMISLLKKEFDPDVREDPRTRQLLQFFEKGYEKLEAKQAPAEKLVEAAFGSLMYGLLLTIMSSLIPTVPYGVTTFLSIICDAFDPHEAFRDAGAWCSKLKRSCREKGRTTDISGVSKSGVGGRTIDSSKSDDCLPWRKSLISGIYEGLPQEEKAKEKDVKRKDITKEFIFVDFNAWECVA